MNEIDAPETKIISRDGFGTDKQLDEQVYVHGDTAKKPDRDLDQITRILLSLEEGDRIRVQLGIKELKITIETTVQNIRRASSRTPPHIGWDYSIEFLGAEGNSEVTRLYRIGKGSKEYDDWSVFNYQYYRGIGLVDDETEIYGGWVIGVTKIEDQ